MANVYWIGVAAGISVGIGVLLAGALAGTRFGVVVSLVAAALGVGVGLLLGEWDEAVGGAIGGLAGGFGGERLVGGTLRRGGTRGPTSMLVGIAALLLAAVAFVPLLGYLETVVLPALGARLRRHAGERYAGLRILARDE